MKQWNLSMTVLLLVWLKTVSLAAPGEIKIGKWSGYLKIDGDSDALALTMDAFIVKPDQRDDFQILKLLFKLNLGGYGSSEYEIELFEDPPYDFDQNILTLDDPKNEMVVRATIQKATKPIMEGKVFIRNSVPPVTGTLRLQYRSDGPTDSQTTEPLAPALAGQYEGKCGGKEAVLQIETGKGLTTELPVQTTGLHHYLITGGLGVENGFCSPVNKRGPSWCLDHAYTAGIYDFFQRKLFLNGSRHTDECTRVGNELTCQTQIVEERSGHSEYIDETCKFKKVSSTPNSRLKIFERKYSLSPTPEQLSPLPKWKPPASKEVVGALSGSFYGYLHHEYRNSYQPIVLNVIASTSQDNLHDQNDVFVSVSAVPYFGQALIGATLTNQFDRRIAYFDPPGYFLQSKDSDAFMFVQDWRKGFISGVWYSKSFGRVGTVEVIKGNELPPLDAGAKTLSGISGNFKGPKEVEGQWYWTLKTIVPKQPKAPDRSYLIFQGNYRQYSAGVSWSIRLIPRGAYDIYTGAVSWMTDSGNGDDPKLVRGYLEDSEQLSLFWPSDRSWSAAVFDHQFGSYLRARQQ